MRAPPSHVGHPWQQGQAGEAPHRCRGSSPGVPLGTLPDGGRRARRRRLPSLVLPGQACPRVAAGKWGLAALQWQDSRGHGGGQQGSHSPPAAQPWGRTVAFNAPTVGSCHGPVLVGTPHLSPPDRATTEAVFSILFIKTQTFSTGQSPKELGSSAGHCHLPLPCPRAAQQGKEPHGG